MQGYWVSDKLYFNCNFELKIYSSQDSFVSFKIYLPTYFPLSIITYYLIIKNLKLTVEFYN